MVTNEEINRLLSAYREGDLGVEEEILSCIRGDCARVINRRVFERENQEDVLQEAMLKILRCLRNLPENLDNPRAYFLMVAKNAAMDHLRKWLRDKENNCSIDALEPISVFDKEPDGEGLREHLLSALFSLKLGTAKRLVFLYNKMIFPVLLNRPSGSPSEVIAQIGLLSFYAAVRSCDKDYALTFTESMPQNIRTRLYNDATFEGAEIIVISQLGSNPKHTVSIWSQRIQNRILILFEQKYNFQN